MSREPWTVDRDRDRSRDEERAASIPPPPSVDSKLPAILIGLAAAAIIGSVVAFFAWPRPDRAPAAIPDAALPPGAQLSIDLEPAGVNAEVTVDGRAITPPATIEAGNRRVRVTADGRMTYVRDIDVVADQPVKLAIQLVPARGEASALAIESTPPGLAVFIDRQATGQVTPAAIELTAGPHAISLRRGDQVLWESALVAQPGIQHGLAPAIANPPPPSDAGPTADAAPAATERTGLPPRIRARDGEEIPGRVAARICIDRRGAVQSVRLFDELDRRVRGVVVRAVEKWRYQPYLRDHKPVPACFEESIPIQIEK